MQHVPKNVKPKKGLNIAYQFLNGSDILRENDLIRSTRYPNLYSDCIDDDKVNAMNWEEAKNKLPGWIGRTIDEIQAQKYINNIEVMRMVILPQDIIKKQKEPK